MSASDWAFDYEQGGLEDLWVYKFDHTPVHDGAWRKLNGDCDMLYRIRDGVLQCLAPHDPASQPQFEKHWLVLSEIAPFPVRGCIESVIRSNSDGYHISERDAETAERVEELTPAGLARAYQTLSERPDRWA